MMSDEVSDDSFVSADEGSDARPNFLNPANENPLENYGHVKDIPVASIIDLDLETCKSSTQDSQQIGLMEYFSLHNPVTDSGVNETIADTNVLFSSSDSWDLNLREVSRVSKKPSVSVDANQPLIDLEEKPSKLSPDAVGVIHTEKIFIKSDYADEQMPKVLEFDDDLQAWDLKDDQWEGSGIALIGDVPTKSIERNSSASQVNKSSLDGKLLKVVTSLQSDKWDINDELAAGSQTLEGKNHSTEIHMTEATNSEGCEDFVETMNLKNNVPSSKADKCEASYSLLRNKPAYDKTAQHIDVELDPRTNCQSIRITEKPISCRIFPKNNVLDEKGQSAAKPPHVEETDVWDLQDDPWTSSEVEDNGNVCETTPKSHGNNDDWNTEVEEEWDNIEDFQAKPSVNTSQELASAATALVKSVGGGLANFVGGFKLLNLSSTLAAFEEKVSTEPSIEEQSSQTEANVDQTTSATPGCDESGSGWGAWNFGSLAKSLTSTVENTGLQIIHGGVDVLEQIGRKTFTALKESDPGLMYTKRFLLPVDNSEVPKLSQILREASDKHTAQLSTESCLSESETRRGDLASQLESRLALVHMEALELLSSRASARLGTRLARLQTLTDIDDEEHQQNFHSLTTEGGVLERIRQTLQLKDKEEKDELTEEVSVSKADISQAVVALETVVSGDGLLKIVKEFHQNSQNLESDLPMKEIFYRAIGELAQTTSAILAYLHKLAECLLLLGQNERRLNLGFLDVAENVANLLTAVKKHNGTICSTYVQHLQMAASSQKTEIDDEEDVKETSNENRRLVVVLFVETEMANSYLDDAAGNHLVSVVQVACLDAFFPDSTSFLDSHRLQIATKAKQR